MTDSMDPLLRYPGQEMLLPDVVRARNCALYDAGGRRYVDLESGVWCTAVGHGNQRVVRAMAEQNARLGHTGFVYSSRVVEAAAQDVLALLGFEGGRCVFLSSGSEAVEYAVRVARAVIDRPLLLTMADSYLGAYGSANRKQPDEWFCFDWSACAECTNARPESVCACRDIIPNERVGGLVFEPGSSAGFVRFPPAHLIRQIAGDIRRSGGLIVANEVTTGVGRTGRWFGYEHYDLDPDIVVLGKGIGNGYPVSVVALRREVAERLARRPLAYAQSHQNDPLGAAAVREVIRVIWDRSLIRRGQVVSIALLAGLHEVQARNGRIGTIRARGLMMAIELSNDPEGALARSVHRELLQHGYIVGLRAGTGVLRLDPALTVRMKDIAGFLDAFEQILGAAIPAPTPPDPI
jgi:acetylornithine/N-succinyldiaminopimelate aminotransferase